MTIIRTNILKYDQPNKLKSLWKNFHFSEPAHKLAKADCKSKKDVVSTEKAEEPFPTPSHKIDMFFDLNFSAKSKAAIYLDYSCMLNQTDIINNVNKFYVIQIAKAKGSYHLFTRWGRIVSIPSLATLLPS